MFRPLFVCGLSARKKSGLFNECEKDKLLSDGYSKCRMTNAVLGAAVCRWRRFVQIQTCASPDKVKSSSFTMIYFALSTNR